MAKNQPFTVEEVLVQSGSFLFHGAYDDRYLPGDPKPVLGFYTQNVEGRVVEYQQSPKDNCYKGVLVPAGWEEKLRQVIRWSKNPQDRNAEFVVHCHKLVPGIVYQGRYPVGMTVTKGLVRTTGPTNFEGGFDNIFGRSEPFEYDPRIDLADDLGIHNPSFGDIVVRVEHDNFGYFPYTREKINKLARLERLSVLDVNAQGKIVNHYYFKH